MTARCHVADPCIRCSSGMGHPPMLAVYSRAAGDYVEAQGDRCIARRASGGIGRAEGDVCGKPAESWAGDVPLCRLHFKRLMSWVAAEADGVRERDVALHEQRLRQAEEFNLQQIRLDRERIAAAAEAKSPYSVVYYIRREGDGAIKIGFTASIKNRMMTLRAQHGPLQVLLVHGGDRDEETEAHSRFREYRIGRTEWFRPVRPLLDWVREARAGHTHPSVQPDGILPMSEIARLAEEAPQKAALRWSPAGVLQWPPA